MGTIETEPEKTQCSTPTPADKPCSVCLCVCVCVCVCVCLCVCVCVRECVYSVCFCAFQCKLLTWGLCLVLHNTRYEVMQFCWLQADQRPNAEEVHLLLNYLCAKCASEAEEDFERRWTSMR